MRDGDDIKVFGGFLPDGKCIHAGLEMPRPEHLKDLEERGATIREATIAECRKAAAPGFKRSFVLLKKAAIYERDLEEFIRLNPPELIEGPF